MKLMCEQHPFSYESHMHFLLYENHIISYDTHVITSYASHMTAFLYKSFHVKFIFILYDNYVWRNWLCIMNVHVHIIFGSVEIFQQPLADCANAGTYLYIGLICYFIVVVFFFFQIWVTW